MRYRIERPQHQIELPKAQSSRPSVLAFSLHKAGSTLLNDILRKISPVAGLTFVSFQDEMFLQGIRSKSIHVKAEFAVSGYCYGGFRFFPHYPVPILNTAKAVWLVRDPRDILVSLYFSRAYSHVIPQPEGKLRSSLITDRENAQSSNIDEWVLGQTTEYIRSMEGYLAHAFVSRPNIAIYRYEDVIIKKRDWVIDMAEWFGWQIPDRVIDRTVEAVDVFPAVPDPTKHIRQVTPGNHKRLLSDATQKKLNARLGEFLNLFEYTAQI